MSQWAKSGGDFNAGDAVPRFINEARKSTGSGAMARTSINAVQDAILKKEGKLNQVRDQDAQRGRLRAQLHRHRRRHHRQDRRQGRVLQQGLRPVAVRQSHLDDGHRVQSAEIAKKGTGRAAMETLLSGDESLKDATVGEMQKDAALRMEDAGTRIRKSVETIRQSIGEQLAPSSRSSQRTRR
jgi:hypothetical protein